MRHECRRSLAIDLLLGAAAGAGATWLMDRATTVLQERQPEEVTKRENAARGGKTAYEIAAEKAAGLVKRKLAPRQRKKLGAAMHWALGTTAGALYGVLRNRLPRLGMGSGLAYGVAFWLLMDEAALAALRLTPPPSEFPWQTHARGLAGHLVLGAGVEAAFDVADRLAA
ncbi:MAG TPA: DUF1440 domain-containing protein [Thermoanaerobaculia bacterium]|jgi:hypothetical protein|nr:DUF1440 domain-containing protein [Thermoanaerobaculia bacterium]